MTSDSRLRDPVATILLLIAITVGCSEDPALTQEEAAVVAPIVLSVFREGFLEGETDGDDFPITYQYTAGCSPGGSITQSGTVDAGILGPDESPDSVYLDWRVDATASDCAETENGIPLTLDGDISLDVRYSLYESSGFELDIRTSGTLNASVMVLNRNTAVSGDCALEMQIDVWTELVGGDEEVVSGEGLAGKACGHSIVIDANTLWALYLNLD